MTQKTPKLPTIAPGPAPWPNVLAGLTGRRLALWDDAQRFGTVTVHGQAVAEAARWLQYHWLLYRESETAIEWRHRPIEAARLLWEKEGPCAAAAAATLPNAECRMSNEQTAERSARAPRQAHQAQWFDLEGYRTS